MAEYYSSEAVIDFIRSYQHSTDVVFHMENNTTCCADCSRKRKALVNTKHGGVDTRLCCTTDLCGRSCPFSEVCYSNAEAPKEMLDWLKQEVSANDSKTIPKPSAPDR